MDAAEFRVWGKKMVDYMADYMENIRDRRPLADIKPGQAKSPLNGPFVPIALNVCLMWGPGPNYHHWGPKALNILRAHYWAAYIDVAI